MEEYQQQQQQRQHEMTANIINKTFEDKKVQCLGKRDKSFAGRIDPKAVEICAVINEREEYYTTSSCSGRCFMYGTMQQQKQQEQNQIQSSSTVLSKEFNEHYKKLEAIDDYNDIEQEVGGDDDDGVLLGSTGDSGIRKTSNDFVRFRISHDLIKDPDRYFNLSTLDIDPSGGADPIRTVGQYDHKNTDNKDDSVSGSHNQQKETAVAEGKKEGIIASTTNEEVEKVAPINTTMTDDINMNPPALDGSQSAPILWFRLEPFILHVACRSLNAASALLAAARPTFKNVGLTTWKHQNIVDNPATTKPRQNVSAKYIVAIWGDEGLDMPLSTPPDGKPLFTDATSIKWLAQLVNERMERNWSKISRFVQSVRSMEAPLSDELFYVQSTIEQYGGGNGAATLGYDGDATTTTKNSAPVIPKSYDVIGDVAVVYTPINDEQKEKEIGKAIMSKNKAIKVVVIRQSKLEGIFRSPAPVPTDNSNNDDNDNGEKNKTNKEDNNNNSEESKTVPSAVKIIAGNTSRNPLITTHSEYGIKCVVDLNYTFFSPRMSFERLRICQQVARGENVLVCFAGIGLEMFQIAAKTECTKVVGIEYNPVAVKCMHLGLRMLQRNKALIKKNAKNHPSNKISIYEDDVCQILPKLISLLQQQKEQQQQQQEEGEDSKESSNDPNDAENKNTNNIDCNAVVSSTSLLFDRVLAPRPKEGYMDGDLSDEAGGKQFLQSILPIMKDRGECHWYDFVADHEFPKCNRTVSMIERVCQEQDVDVEILHVANAGSVAMRQLRVCIDFRISHKTKST